MKLRGKFSIRTWLVATLALVGALIGATFSIAAITANPTPVCAANVCTVTFAAGNEYSYTLPAGTQVTMTIKGARGGNGGNDSSAGGAGVGGDVVSFTTTSDGTAYSIYPGNAGGTGGSAAANSGGAAGGTSAYPGGAFNGGAGGNAGGSGSSGGGGGGGAASVVKQGSTLYVAGGGGGAGGGNNGCVGSNAHAYSASFLNSTSAGAVGAYPGGLDGSGGGGGGGGLLGGTGGTLSVLSACSGEQHGDGGYTGSNSAPSGATINSNGNLAAGVITFSWPDKISATVVPAQTFTKTTSISYTVTFGESVTGLAAADFSISGTATGCSVSAVTGSGASYTVTVSGCAAPVGSKTVILSMAQDAATNASAKGTMAVVAATVTLDDVAPTAVITGPSPVAQTAAFDFVLNGSEALDNIAAADFSLTGTGCSIDTVTGTGATRTIHVIGCANGTVATLTLAAGSVTDLAGNTAPASAITSAITVDIPAVPTVLTTTVLTGETSTGANEGTTLTVTNASFGPANHGNVIYNSYTYVWYRCYSAQATASSAVASDCLVIPSATSANYTTTTNDVGYFIRGSVVASNASGTIFSASANSSIVRETDVLSTGEDTTCQVKEGLVYCWGLNNYGQAGNGTTVDVLSPSAQPVKLANGSNLTNVISIDTSFNHTCALTSAGAMYCWGINNFNQLGDGTTVAKSVATPVTSVSTGSIGFSSGVVAIDVGDNATCAVKAGGALFCWGYSANYGQIGDGTTTSRAVPTQVLTAASTPLAGVSDVSIDVNFACALTNSSTAFGQVYCWGYNGHGELGDGTTTTRYYAQPAQVSSTTFASVTDISVGMYNACAVQSGAAMCWGYNGGGNLGDGTNTARSNPTQVAATTAATPISFSSGVVDVEVSQNNLATSCFTKNTGALYCVGQGTSGQLTDGTILGKTTPVASTIFTSGVTAASLGDIFTCAIDASGLTCVGSDSNGQLGDGQATATVNKTGVDLAAFTAHLGTVDEKPVAAATTITGYSGTGMTMTGTTVVEPATASWYGYPLPALTYQWLRCNTASPTAVIATDCVSISGATNTTYTVTASDLGKYLRMQTIGTNSAGVSNSYSDPSGLVGTAPVNTALPTIALNAGAAGAIPGDSATVTPGAWTGSPSPTTAYAWYRCSGSASASTTAAPTDCAVISDATGKTYTFTQSDVGSYIRGIEAGQSTSGVNYAYTATVGPVQESHIMASGLNFTCAIKLGFVYCWGYNANGQLGDGTTVAKNSIPTTPLKLADGSYLKNVVSIDAGNSQACALTTAGAMYCWGYNGHGELGDGTTVDKLIPTPVSGLSSGVVAITTGYYTSCAVKTGGAVYCWGYNAQGSIGDNTATSKSVPTAVNNMTSGVTQVSSGNSTTCAIKSGALYCWGYNAYGMLGDGTTTSSKVAIAVPGMGSKVTDIAEGWAHTCAIKDGAAYCWGYNANGQLGDGTVTQRTSPTAVADTAAATPIKFSSGVTDVDVSEYDPGFTCFTKQSQKIYCVGGNAQGQLGTGNATQPTVAVAPALFPGSITGVGLGRYHTCVIMDAQISCIGYNANGELASGTNTSSSTTLSTQATFGNPTGALDVAPVAAGAYINGYSGTGQTLNGSTVLDPLTGTWVGYSYPVLTYQWWSCTAAGAETFAKPSDCTAISGATSASYTPVAGDFGKLLRFEVIGTNSAGVTLDFSAATAPVGASPANTTLPTIALNAGSAGAIIGDSATMTQGAWSGTPVPTSTFRWYRCQSSASASTLVAPTDCVLVSDASGKTYTFTQSDVGSYIRGIEISESTSGITYAYTASVGPVLDSRVLAAGWNHTCAIKLGFVYCWGYNGNGQLGDGTTVAKTAIPATPVKLADGTYLKNVVSVDAEYNMTCALTTAGAMYCWGYNGYGQLGDGTTTDKLVPTPVTGLSSGVVGIAVGSSTTCAIKTGGSLYCWGYNANGQVGDNTSTQRTTPTQVITATNTPITNVVQVAADYQTTCAIRSNGALLCWGYNGNGMVGDGTTSARWMPTAVSGMASKVSDITVGYYNTCAVKDGAAYCWGYNYNGQLGDGTVTQRTSPTAVLDTTATPAVKLSTGVVDVESADYDPGYTCFTKQNGKAYCVGSNAQGQLATGNTTQATTPVAATLFSGKVTAMALGRYHTCAVMDAQISCIGYGVNGELANSPVASSSTVLSNQVAFGNPTGALDVLPVSGGAFETGYTGVGQVVTGSTNLDPLTGTWVGYSYPTLTYQWLRCGSTGAATFAVPSDCKPITDATNLTYTSTAADVGNYLRFEVIGTNSAGVTLALSAASAQVGLTPSNTALLSLADVDGGYAGSIPGVVETINPGSWSGTPTPAVTYTWYRCFTSVVASTLTAPGSNDCQTISGATAKTYTLTGSDVGYYVRGVEVATSTSGQTLGYSQTTTQVHESHTIVAGDNHTCSIRLGRVYCWGLNTSGQLGDGTLVSKTSATGPVKLSNGSILENVVSITAGAYETCAITVQGALYCWGTETYGEFGDGVTSATYTAAVQAKLNSTTVISDAVGLAAGNNHTCVIRSGGSVWCWGYNVYGQVGDGTTTNRSYPVQAIASGVQQVSADYMQTCALVSGAMKCWGFNGNYDLGDGTNTGRTSPVAVTGMSSGVSFIAAGYAHTCAIKNGGAYCWGYNGYGQLGDGTVTTQSTPVAVANSAAGVSFAQDVIAIDASESNPEHTCLVKVGGSVYCFGVGANSALANGATANSTVPSPSTLWTSGVTEISTGYQFTCVTKSGADYCTGYNASGQVGNGTTTNATGSVAISAIADNAGALDVAPYAGTTSVSGTPALGQTLTGTSTGWSGFPMPTVTLQWYNCVNPGVSASAIPTDCALISGATNSTYVPVASDVGNYIRLVATATSAAGTVNQVTAGQLVGMLPDATFIARTTAPNGFMPIGTLITQSADQWSATPAATVTNAWYRCAASGSAVEVVPTDCSLIAGATGLTYTTTQSDVGSYIRGAQVATNSIGTTVALAPTAGFVAETRTVAVGAQSTCVVKAGEVWCAGLGTSGQLGNNAILSSSTPVKVLTAVGTSLNKVISVSGNNSHFCALTESGALYCWGQNTYGAIGNNTTTNQSMAVLVTSGTSYAAVDSGVSYTCAIKVGGALYCWGLNTSYQIGDGTATSKSVPTAIASMASGVSQVSAGWQSTCAIKSGAAYCWGSNTNYQLGDGTVTARTAPVAVSNLASGVTDISVSTISACAVQNGAALCWGNNAVGQAGAGTATANYSVPTQVVATASGVAFTSGVADVEVSVNNNSIDSTYITKSDGSLYAFGSQVNGVLFNTVITGSSNKAIAATGYATGVSEVSAGWGDVCVVKSGALGCVGLNDNGQLFNSPATLNSTAVTTPTAPAAFASALGDVALAPTLVTAPSVYSSPGLANVAPADPGAFSSNPAATLTYAWYSCTLTSAVSTSAPADCALSSGSGASTLNYTPVAADQGKFLRLSVTATNSAGSVTSVSATSANAIAKGDQTITFGPVINPVIGGGALALSATASSSLPVTFTSATPSICTVSNGQVTAIAGGRCQIDATQAGNASFNAATASLELFVDKAANVITFTAADRSFSSSTVALAGVASSGLAVSYAAVPATVCTVSGSALTLVNVGTCVITATQDGSATVNAANPVVVSMSITKATQTISVPLAASVSVLNLTGVAVSGTATSGGAVVLDTVDASVCKIVNGYLIGVSTGTCTVSATQVGDSKYQPASATFTTTITRAPSVSAVTTNVASPTNLVSVGVGLVFDTSVTGLTASDLSTSPTACTVSSVTGSGTAYSVTLTNCADGPVSLVVAANSVSNGGDGPTNAYTSAVLFTEDRTAPTVVSAVTSAAALTNVLSVDFTVTFSEPVSGFTAADVLNSGSAASCVPSVTAVSSTVYTVTMASCGEGTVGVKIAASGVADVAGNNGPVAAFVGSTPVTIDRTAATVVSAVSSASANTKTSPVPFVVTFSEPVTGFDASDISGVGTATGCQYSVTAVSSTVYNVSVASCTDGTVGIKVASGSVVDLAGNVSPAAAFSSSTVTLDTTAPTAPTFTTTASNPTNVVPVPVQLTFAEPVTGLTASDLTVTGTATSCVPSVTAVSSTVYNVSLAGCSDGTVAVKLAANGVSDTAGNAGPAADATSSTLTTIDRVAPTVVSVATTAPVFTNVEPIPFTITFGEPVADLVAADLKVTGSASGCVITITKVSSTVFTAGVAACSADGTVGLQVLAAAVNDLAGNAGPAAALSSNTVTLDTIAPAAPVVSNMPGDFTNATSIEATFPVDARNTYSCEFDGTPITCPAGQVNLGAVTPLADGAHNLKVFATDAAGNTSVASNFDWTVGTYAKPLAPDAPVASRPTLTTMSIAWNKPVASAEIPIKGYELQYTTDSITWLPATKTVGADSTNYTLPGVTSGVVYKFRVKALAQVSQDSSDWSAEGPYVAVYIPNITMLSVGQSTLVPPAGATLTITGQDFKAGQTTVQFGTTDAPVQSVSADGTQMVVTVPPATVVGPVDVNVSVGSGQFKGASLKRAAFTYVAAVTAPTVTHTPPTGITVAGAPASLSASLNSGATPVFTIASESAAICRLDNGNTIVGLAAGTCNYTVSAPSTLAYTALAPKAYSTVIGKGANLITIGVPAELASGTVAMSANGFALTASSAGGIATAVSVGPAAVCFTDETGQLFLIGLGTCTITATSGDANYQTATATKVITVTKGQQTLTVVKPGTLIPGTTTLADQATNKPTGFQLVASSSSALPLTYVSQNPEVCNVDEVGIVTWLVNPSVGSNANCAVAISQAGNAQWEAIAPQIVTLTASKYVGPPVPDNYVVPEPTANVNLPHGGGQLDIPGAGKVKVSVNSKGFVFSALMSSFFIGVTTNEFTIGYKAKNKSGVMVNASAKCTLKAGATKAMPIKTAAQKKAAYAKAKVLNVGGTCALNKDALAYYKSGKQLTIRWILTKDRRWPTTYGKVVPKDAVAAGLPYSKWIGIKLYSSYKVTNFKLG